MVMGVPMAWGTSNFKTDDAEFALKPVQVFWVVVGEVLSVPLEGRYILCMG